jgi:predicted nucleic acid-binding protein
VTESVFVDTDIILDLLTRRDPFYPAASRLFTLVERGELQACASSLAFGNLFYILRKEITVPRAVEVLKKLKFLLTVLPVDEPVISRALDSSFRDFEDAIQYHTALAGKVATLLTRNGRDYPNPSITVWTAEEFLARRAVDQPPAAGTRK